MVNITKNHIEHLAIECVSKPPVENPINIQTGVKPLFDKIKDSQIQIKTLTNLRENLLPKLMSGDVRVES